MHCATSSRSLTNKHIEPWEGAIKEQEDLITDNQSGKICRTIMFSFIASFLLPLAMVSLAQVIHIDDLTRKTFKNFNAALFIGCPLGGGCRRLRQRKCARGRGGHISGSRLPSSAGLPEDPATLASRNLQPVRRSEPGYELLKFSVKQFRNLNVHIFVRWSSPSLRRQGHRILFRLPSSQ